MTLIAARFESGIFDDPATVVVCTTYEDEDGEWHDRRYFDDAIPKDVMEMAEEDRWQAARIPAE